MRFERLVAAECRIRGSIHPDDPDVVGERHTGLGLPAAEPGEALLDLGHDLGALGIGELQVCGRAFDEDEADRHGTDEIEAGLVADESGGTGGAQLPDMGHVRAVGRQERCAVRRVPALAVTRPFRLRRGIAP
jgi:hypothetical protein